MDPFKQRRKENPLREEQAQNNPLKRLDGDKLLKERSFSEVHGYRGREKRLYRALEASICECPSCSQTDRDMVYNAPLKEWYCTLCAQEYRDFYHKNKAIYGDFSEDDDDNFYETFL